MEEERDLVTFSDDDGNEFELEVIDYFEHEGQDYAVLVDAAPAEEDENSEMEVYIMKIVVNGEYEEFLPADEDKMDTLVALVEERFAADECGCGCEHDDCDCGHDDCDCEHEHEHEHCGCGCGCEDK